MEISLNYSIDKYCQVSNMKRTSVGNSIVDHSVVVGAACMPWNLWYKPRICRQWDCWSFRCSCSTACRRCPNYIFILDFNTWLQWIGQRQLQDEIRNIWVLWFWCLVVIVDRWPQFECNFNVLPIWFCHAAVIASTWQPVLEPINGVTGTRLSCFAMCDWPRTLVHLHCDVMITTSTTKTWWSCRSLGGRLAMLKEENLPSKYNVNEMKSM